MLSSQTAVDYSSVITRGQTASIFSSVLQLVVAGQRTGCEPGGRAINTLSLPLRDSPRGPHQANLINITIVDLAQAGRYTATQVCLSILLVCEPLLILGVYADSKCVCLYANSSTPDDEITSFTETTHTNTGTPELPPSDLVPTAAVHS